MDDRGDQKLAAGVAVALREAAYGYAAGARGVVVSSTVETAQVRIEATGHTIPVARELLERA